MNAQRFNPFARKAELSAGDSNGKMITTARRCMTIAKTLHAVNKTKVMVPVGAYDVNITNTAGAAFKYYEGKAHDANGDYATYSEDGQTFGTGKTSGDLMVPCYDDEYFWLLGIGTTLDVEITFYTIREA